MSQPPRLPEFDKAKFAEQPLFAAFWELIQPHLKLNARALDRGLSVSENGASGWVDIPITATQTFPLAVAPPLPSGLTPYGVVTAGIFDAANPGQRLLDIRNLPVFDAGEGLEPYVELPPPGVTVEWAATPEGGLTVLAITGLPPGRACVVRVIVLAR